jgi:iron complex outermembrane receptor protein
LGRIAAFSAVSLVLLWGPATTAQTAASGSIAGKIEDAQGAALPGATVTVTGPALQGARTAQTDAAGLFRVDDLPPGTYTLAVELKGFSRPQRSVTVTAGATVTANLALQLRLTEDIVVTAQRRETLLQTTPVAVSAFAGNTLAENKIFTVADLASAVPAFSLTAGTPLDVELNVRGVTNTRLDSPSADPSVGTFLDGVYVGRTGDLNFDLYDLERIEVIRGPQGVLLGKNVVGGALNIVTAKPSFQKSASLLLSYGNYDAVLAAGHATGRLSDSVAGRLSFQVRTHSGYGEDILHNREVETLDSYQGRAQLLYHADASTWTARAVIDYNKDSSNGINVVAIPSTLERCEGSYLRTNCTRPWSSLRRYLGLTDPRVNVAQSVQYAGDASPTQQFMKRRGVGLMLDVQKDFGGFSFNSLTGYRDGRGRQLYDQTGAGPEALGWDRARWAAYTAFVTQTRPAGTTANGLFLFAEPVNEDASIKQFSQELRLTSTDKDSRVDWIAGVYLKKDSIDKVDHFIGETFLGGPLATLSGESLWNNRGDVENYAAFAQLGLKLTDRLKLSAGVRYTRDKKDGTVSGTAIETGDRFNPLDPRPLTPLAATFTRGGGFSTPYEQSWSKTTPQATLEYTHSRDLFLYATVATGFKGGGYDDTPANAAQAQTPYDPEKATNYEAGFKSTLFERRLRLNVSGFYMDYKDLQVVQTNAACLCNLTDNAASATLKGVEGELELDAGGGLRIFASGSYVDAKYEDFLETAINPSTGQRLDSSGNRLQRTPATQLSGGFDLTTRLGKWRDGFNLRVNYTWQGDLKWATDNIAEEPSYGLLDARLGVGPKNEKWQVSAYAKNLTDELYRVNIIHFFGEEVSQFGPPRTFGVEFSYSIH